MNKLENKNAEMAPESRMTRRTFLKTGGRLFAGMLILPIPAYGYARYAEPRWVQTNKVPLTLDRLPEAMSGMRLLQFSDVHLGPYYSPDALIQLVERINNLNPDLVCFTGDLYDSAIFSEKDVIEALSGVKAAYGKFAVLGNHDYIDSAVQVSKLWEASGFQLLKNNAFKITKDRESIIVAGVDDFVKGRPDLAKALNRADPSVFTLLLSHAPDFADTASRYPVDLQLSGHSHGGQVRLPWIGPIVTPLGAKKYVDGLYKLKEGKFFLYANRGIGVSLHPVRFCCRPELTLFELHRSSSGE